MGSSANLIQVGAVVDLGQYKAGMQDAVATTEATTQEMSASFKRMNSSTHEAMAGMAFAVEDSGVKMSRHFRRMLAEIPLVNQAFTAIMPVLAMQVGFNILKDLTEKLTELISDTFIYTEAEKNAEKAIAASNVELQRLAEHTKTVSRERQLAAAGTKEQTQLKLKFAIEDEGDPAKLQQRLTQIQVLLKDANAEMEKARLKIDDWTLPTGKLAIDFANAKTTVESLNNEFVLVDARLKDIKETTGQITDEGARKMADESKHAAKEEQQRHDKFVAMVYAERQAMADKADAHEKAEAQETIAVTKEVEKQNQAIIAAVDEQIRVWDEAYKGQIEAAKIASENRIQLIEQDFLKGKLNQQQEIAAIAQEKERELQIEKLAQQQRWALWDGDKKKQQDIQNQINKIVAQGQLAETKAVTDGLKASDQKWKNFANSVSSSLNSALSGWIQGTQTFGQAWGKMADDMAMKFIASLERQLVEMLVHVATKEAVDQAYYAKSGLRSAYSAAKKSFDWASQFVGPILAAPIAAAAFIAVESMGSYDVGTNYVPMDGLAMLHRGEKVIPASAQGPGYSGGGSAELHVHFNVSAFDGEGVDRILTKHRKKFSDHFFKEAKKKGFGGK